MRLFAVTALAAVLAASPLALQTPQVRAQTTAVYTPTSLKAEPGVPKGKDGHPDLQGVWESPYIGGLTGIPFVTPNQLVITEQQSTTAHDALVRMIATNPQVALDPEIVDLMKSAKGFPVVRGQRRSRLMVLPADGKLPLTSAAQAELGRATISLLTDAFKADNPEQRMPTERCLTQGGSAPMQIPPAFSPVEIVQTRDHVVVHSEIGNEARIASFAPQHGPAALAPPMGDAIARWEGDTLVIETTHSPMIQRMRVTPMGGLIINPSARVIERFTRVSREEIVYQFTVEDPTVYTAPWLGEFSLYRSDYRLSSSACHEANYGLANILSGARYEEANPTGWRVALLATTMSPAAQWIRSIDNPVEVRSWAILTSKNAAGEASIGLRIEREKPAAGMLSEINVFTLDCAGQRLRQETVATYAGQNLTGDKRERAGAGGWLPVNTRPALSAGVAKACSS